MRNLQSKRLISLDVFRGITIALMIIVNSPGTLTPYTWLLHSVWDGCTLADLVFPFFIVILGVSSVLALSHLKAKGVASSSLFEKVVKRSVYIFLMGLLLNAFPHHFNLETLRILGVLQRISICYFCASLLYLTTRAQTQAIGMVTLLLGYACLTTLITPVTGTHPLSLSGNMVGYIDRLVFSPAHLYTTTFDPEGLLSTLPAIASAILGNLIGIFLLSTRTKKQCFQGMLLSGLLLTGFGWLWGLVLPVNKALWSSAYVLYTGGLALFTFSVVYALIEIKQWTWWSKPFDCFGRHAMLVYVLHIIFLKIQAMIHMSGTNGEMIPFRLYITDVLFGQLSLQNASLCYSLCYMLLWLLTLGLLRSKP